MLGSEKSNFPLPVMARRTSLAASSRASTEACSLYHDVWGVQIRLGASFRGPVEKLFWRTLCCLTSSQQTQQTKSFGEQLLLRIHLKGSVSWTSKAAPRIRPSFRAWARAFSSTRPPLDVFTRKAPWRICAAEEATVWVSWKKEKLRDGALENVKSQKENTCLIVKSFMRWWLCSLRLQCRETQSEWMSRSCRVAMRWRPSERSTPSGK